jgi:hypothetical protein
MRDAAILERQAFALHMAEHFAFAKTPRCIEAALRAIGIDRVLRRVARDETRDERLHMDDRGKLLRSLRIPKGTRSFRCGVLRRAFSHPVGGNRTL